MLHKLWAKHPVSMNILGGPFRGARMLLNPSDSKRKVFGIYEHVLNEWITKTIIGKQFVLDIGANTGYDTYGFAYLLSKNNSDNPVVLAFEPDMFEELQIPQQWDCYSSVHREIIKKYVGKLASENTVTIDDVVREYSARLQGSGLIKIDIEGSEIDALKGATQLLDDSRHDWLIEIHKELTPVPFLGAELRSEYTPWLVTI
jgi:Methyltransferase FkbM domain